jgi:hypothetical protein
LVRGVRDRPSSRVGDGSEDIVVIVGVLGCVENAVYGLFFFGQVAIGIVIKRV